MIVAKRYRLAEMIGEGGMARIWRCHDQTLDRQVAVKFLFLREDRDQDTLVRRFLGEARIAAAVRHPNVVDIIDFGTSADGRPFMVMELLEGESLESRIGEDPSLTLEELVHIVSGTLDGLQAVHKAGIVHRDLKPDNIFLLDDDGIVRPKLLDFGVSRDTDPSSGRRSALTTTDGYLVGTPEYMSPEQARGLKDIDLRTDIYSIGVVLYESLCGVLPYDAEAVGDLIIEIAAGGADPAHVLRPELGRPISNVISQAMAIDPDHRFQTARDMKIALLFAAEESLGRDVRPSLPVVVPARHMLESGPRKVPSGNGTMDGEMPWGPGAVPSFPKVPSFDARVLDETGEMPLESASDDPEGFEIDVELPPDAGSSKRAVWPWIAAAAILVLASFGGGWVLLTDDAPAPVVVDAAGEAPDPEPVDEAPEEIVEPTVEEDETEPLALPIESDTVSVTLRGLSIRSEVSIDGVAVQPNELGVLSIPRDDEDHEIRVEGPRRQPYSVTHHANAHGVYEVGARRGAARRGAPRRSRGSADRAAAAPATEEPHSGGVFRDLDY